MNAQRALSDSRGPARSGAPAGGIDPQRLLDLFLALARISSPSGQEGAVAGAVSAALEALGLEPERDAAGNLLAVLPGEGEPLLVTAHMDTVGPCDRVQPVVRDGVVYSDGTTVLGADDKSGVAIMLEVLRVLVEEGASHRPVEALFTVREEVGLEGAKEFDISRLTARMGVGLDAGGPQGTIVVSAPAQDSLFVRIHGRAAHAGVAPEQGVNAIRAAAEAIVDMPLGRIDEETTANVGVIEGGKATNVVPDLVTLRGEARSRSEAKLQAQTQRMVEALQRRAEALGARAEVQVRRAYSAYNYGADTPVVRLVSGAMRDLGVEPCLVPTGGGSDANIFHAAGVPTVQISTGMAGVHTTEEHIALEDMAQAARIVLGCLAR